VNVYETVRSGYRAGLSLLPVKADGSKQPDLTTWREYQTRRPSADEIRAFAWAGRAGYGVVSGEGSSRRECWDFDCGETFEAFVERAHASGLGAVVDRIRAGYEDLTPGGGRRWIVAYPEGTDWRDCTLARRPGRDGEPTIKTLIELPTFAILAPSNGATHPSGRAYVRQSGDFSTITSYAGDERAALLDLARSFDCMPRREYQPAAKNAGKVGTRPGDEFNARTSWPEILEPHGWTRVGERSDVTLWRRPGKTIGVSATTNVHGSDLLYVFTSSTPFEPDKSYTRFGAYAVLQHGGDFAAAAAGLAEQGYGAPRHERARRERPAEPASNTAAPSWRWLADVARERPRWLWRGRLARGCLTLWIGDGGLGKSRASNDLAARITIGGQFPDGEPAPEGNVVILSSEDAASYTIRPAIEAAGGDVRRVAILDAVRDGDKERTFNLATDLPALEALLDATGAVLVIVDPLSAYFGTRLDSYRDSDVRSVLAPLVRLAEARDVAVLGIMHVGKTTDRQARHRVLGSVAFVNAARLVFAIGPDPEDGERRLLVPVKSNLCREAPALAFRLEDAGDVARVVWEGAPVPGINADTVLAGKPAAEQTDQTDAEHVIRELLDTDDWPIEARRALDAGQAHGIPDRTMRWTARRLGIEIRRVGFGRSGRWLWHRPTDATGRHSGSTGNASLECVSVAPVAPMPIHSGNPAISTHRGNNNTPPARAREDETCRNAGDDDLPACLAELTEPDLSDPTGARDAEAAAPVTPQPDPWATTPRPPGSDAAAATVSARVAAGGLQAGRRRRP
jgi:hypothetical protein